MNVPKSFLRYYSLSDWTVEVDGASVSYTAIENGTHTSLYFEQGVGNHRVEIAGTETGPEAPFELAPPLMFVAAAALLCSVTLSAALIDFRKTRKVLGHNVMNPTTNSFR